jgi:hypothetical protein
VPVEPPRVLQPPGGLLTRWACRQLRRRLLQQRRGLLGQPRDRLTGVAALYRGGNSTFTSTPTTAPITVSMTRPYPVDWAPAA